MASQADAARPGVFTLVVGAGYTGRRVLERLPTASAVGLRRSASTDERCRAFDIDEAERLPLELPDAYDVIYTVPPGGGDDHRLDRFLGLLSRPPRRFVYLSTTGVYGDHGGRRVSEETPVNPGNPRSAARVAAERRLLDWSGRLGVALVILRVPGIYGPGRLGIDRLRSGTTVIRERDAGPGNRIHVDDLATCCIAALDDDVPAGVYNVGDGDHRSATWFSGEVARQSGLAEPAEISRARAEREFSPMRLEFLSESRVVDTSRMREILGVTPQYADPVDGIGASLG